MSFHSSIIMKILILELLIIINILLSIIFKYSNCQVCSCCPFFVSFLFTLFVIINYCFLYHFFVYFRNHWLNY